MPWYYAGPDAKPVGPVTLEELHARRWQGAVKPETYVIEHTGQTVENMAWKRYQDLFPATSPQPPPAAPVLTPPPVPPVTSPPVAQPHPLFPSAAPAAGRPPVFAPDTRPDPYYGNAKPTNPACAWGFGLGLTGFFFSIACGSGLLLALPSLLLCVVGLAQVTKNPQQTGKGLAVAGLVLSTIAVIIALSIVYFVDLPIIKSHSMTVTEQTSNDSE